MMRCLKFFLFAILMAATLRTGHTAEIPDPLKFMEQETRVLFEILKSRDPNDPENIKMAREKIRTQLFKIFDGRRVSALALARNLRSFNEEQFKQFSDAFSELLYLKYLETIESYSGEQFLFSKFAAIDEGKTTVDGKVITADKEIPFSYDLILTENRWRIFDIKVEGISLIQNYRTQFREFLVSNTPDALIAQVKEKVEQLDQSINHSAAK